MWNKDSIGAHLRSWLKSVTTVRISEEDGLKSMRYYPATDKYGPHFDTEDLSDLVVLPADAPDRKRQTVQEAPEEEEDLVDRDAEKGRVTLGHFKAGRPHGLAWQWQSERMLEGFLYGDLEAGGGRGFTGSDLLYIRAHHRAEVRGRQLLHHARPHRARILGPAQGWAISLPRYRESLQTWFPYTV